jgi:hypothetical protein
MAMQTRVPGAASSEVDFELERFERTADDRIEISGRWYGLRGRRFVRPVLNLNSEGSRRRAIALLEHKPWAAEDGQVWLAAFRWPDGAGEVSGAELEVGPGLLVDLPALGGKAGSASVRVTALRPQIPALPPWRAEEEDEGGAALEGRDGPDEPTGHRRDASLDPTGRESSDPAGRRGRTPDPTGRDSSQVAGRRGRAPEPTGRDSSEAAGRRGRAPEPTGRDSSDPAGRRDRDSSHRRTAGTSARDAVPAWTDAPRREAEFEARARRAAPPRDVVASLKAERDEAIAARDKAERDRVTALQDRDDALSRRDAALRDVDRAITEREEAVAERDRLTAELERVTRERDHAHAERSRMMQDSEAVARERDQAAAEREAARSELSRALPAREQAIRERERDTALAERKSAVAQRDRARRERDRAMRAAGVEPPEESPYVSPVRAAPLASGRPSATAGRDPAEDDVAAPAAHDDAGAEADPAPPHDVVAEGAEPAPIAHEQRDVAADGDPTLRDVSAPAAPTHGDVPAAGSDLAAATPPGTPLPSRPIKRIGAGPLGPSPEPKSLLTPVDSGSPRRLSRSRRPPSTTARWAVRITVILLMLAIAVVLLMLIGRAL